MKHCFTLLVLVFSCSLLFGQKSDDLKNTDSPLYDNYLESGKSLENAKKDYLETINEILAKEGVNMETASKQEQKLYAKLTEDVSKLVSKNANEEKLVEKIKRKVYRFGKAFGLSQEAMTTINGSLTSYATTYGQHMSLQTQVMQSMNNMNNPSPPPPPPPPQQHHTNQ